MSSRHQPSREEIEALHARRFGYMSMLRTRFTLPHMIGLYQRFGGDLALPIVLGEIAARNLQGVYQMRIDEPYDVLDHRTEDAIRQQRHSTAHFRPANAYSVAQATGIPRETVRRKLEKLIALGWVERNARGHLFLTPKVREDLGAFDRDETVRFVLASASVFNALADA
jgi:hypothetical protein